MGRAKIVLTCAAIALGNGAQAGGLDRAGQSLGPLFEKGRYLSVDVSSSQPRIQGTDILGHSTGQVAASYTQWGFAYKQDLNPQTSMLIMLSHPFGLDLRYDRQASSLFGGTQATLKTLELMGALRYQWDEHWGLHGGLRMQRSEGSVALGGLAFGASNGYRVDFRPSTEPGYLLGMSYERPDTALRIAATYYSEIRHKMDTAENMLPGSSTMTPSVSPQSLNLDVQAGLTSSTLLFGQIRWTNWARFKLSPQAFAQATRGGSLADLENTTTYTLGLGRKLSSQWSGFVSVAYDPRGDTTASSPLRPSNGRVGYAMGLSYQAQQFKFTPWVSYQRLGDANISSGNTPMASMASGSATAFGIKLSYSF